MATGYAIKWLKDKLGTSFFPITHLKAVRNDNNVNLETLLGQKQDELMSGVNIKTIDNNPIVGNGNLTLKKFIIFCKENDSVNELGDTWLKDLDNNIIIPEINTIYILRQSTTNYILNTLFIWNGNQYEKIL